MTRPNSLRTLAERAASHPRIEQAVMTAIRAELPGVIESLLHDMHDGGGTVRLYSRKIPSADRTRRDARVRSMLAAGTPPEIIAVEVGCSRTHVYRLRKSAERQRAGAQCQSAP